MGIPLILNSIGALKFANLKEGGGGLNLFNMLFFGFLFSDFKLVKVFSFGNNQSRKLVSC